MKICVLGNSHVAAIKLACDQIVGNANSHSMTFFAGQGPKITNLDVVDGVLKPQKFDTQIQFAIKATSGGLTEVDPMLYDQFLVVGLCINVHRLVQMSSSPISENARKCAIVDYWNEAPASRLLKKLREITSKPISFGITPMIASTCKAEGVESDYNLMIQLSDTYYFQNMGVSLVEQPSSTIVNGCNTKLEYSRGSVRLRRDVNGDAIRHPDGERRHMNSQYGKLWLKEYFNGIDLHTF